MSTWREKRKSILEGSADRRHNHLMNTIAEMQRQQDLVEQEREVEAIEKKMLQSKLKVHEDRIKRQEAGLKKAQQARKKK